MKDNSRNNCSLKVLSHQVLKDHYDLPFCRGFIRNAVMKVQLVEKL